MGGEAGGSGNGDRVGEKNNGGDKVVDEGGTIAEGAGAAGTAKTKSASALQLTAFRLGCEKHCKT